MAGWIGRAALITAWTVTLGGLGAGAAYLHLLGPPDGPQATAAPERAPEDEAQPAQLDAPHADADLELLEDDHPPAEAAPTDVIELTDGDGAQHDGVSGDTVPPELVGQAPPAPLPHLDTAQTEPLPPAISPVDDALPTHNDDHQVPVDAGIADAGSLVLAEDSHDLMAESVPDIAEPAETVAPTTGWSVRTPSLHGPMPIAERQTIDLDNLVPPPPPVVADSPAIAAPALDQQQSADGPEHMEPAPDIVSADHDAPSGTPEEHPTIDHGVDDDLAMLADVPDGHTEAPGVLDSNGSGRPAVDSGGNHGDPTPSQPAPAENLMADAGDALTSDPDERVVEVADVGPLPVVALTGERPWEVYARPFDHSGGRPVVAIVVGGLGLSSAATEAAIQSLPGAVSLSFSPYSGRLHDWVALARAAGHEVLIDLPMEPADFPNSDPGPQALMTGLDSAGNMQRLEWVLSRATNYVGVGSYMGSRFAANAAAMRPVLEAINARGLIYLDNDQAIGDVATTLSAEIGLPVVVSDLKLDRMASRHVIDEALAEIEAMALRDGAALAIGTAYPVTIERLAVWSRGLAQRGIDLAPVTALISQ